MGRQGPVTAATPCWLSLTDLQLEPNFLLRGLMVGERLHPAVTGVALPEYTRLFLPGIQGKC